MAREGLQLELREALGKVGSQGLASVSRDVQVTANGGMQTIRLDVRQLPDADGSARNMLLISFQELAAPLPAARARKPRGALATALRIDTLERELADAKERMKAMLEEQQASNEELESTNEELQSTNEESPSTNEELETSKEELQSVNEKLMTVNSELQTKIEQMAGIQEDMKNWLDNIRVGTIFLDRQLLIRRYTRDATKVYRLASTDLGRPLADIRSELQGDDLLGDAQSVLDTLTPVEREVHTAAGTWYLARILPYRTVDNVIDGVVLTFTDVTEHVQAIATRKARDLAEAIVNTVHDPLVVLDVDLHVASATCAFYREFGGSPQDTAGKSLFDTGAHQWDFPALHELLEQVLPRERSFERHAVAHDFPGRGPRQLQLSARRIVGPNDDGQMVLLVIEAADADRA